MGETAMQQEYRLHPPPPSPVQIPDTFYIMHPTDSLWQFLVHKVLGIDRVFCRFCFREWTGSGRDGNAVNQTRLVSLTDR
ncbi:UNVERIFIED_CONTAM: hypothetical protein FKN15_052018 [Acipenser sinensis]